ncbi:TPA: hypothetical protein ACTXXA_003585 [Legionella anisa]
MLYSFMDCLNWNNLLSGFIGAIIGGLLSLAATYLTHSLEKKRQLAEEDNRGKVFLKSIQSEIENIFCVYNDRVGKQIEELEDETCFNFIFPIKQNYFNIYESQTSLLGLVKNEELRSKIINCYIEMKGIVDSFLMNNTLLGSTPNKGAL